MELARKRLEDCFKQVDIRNTGKIEEDLLLDAMLEISERLQKGWSTLKDDMRKVFAFLQATEDGRVDYMKFLSWLFPETTQASRPPNHGRFISTMAGSWTLRSKGGHTLEGSYKFDSGILTDVSSGERIGTFLCDPISAEALTFPLDPQAVQPIESISIADSEIMSEIQKPSSEGAYFVLPSQLNGAEYPSHHTVVTRIQDYMTDNTGGPRGQLAVHPAAGQFVIDNAASDSNEAGINAIDVILQAAKTFKLVNGYLKMPMPQNETESNDYLSSFMGSLHTLRPLLMADVQACGLTADKRGFSDVKHRVNLVYASAVPVDSYLNRAQTPLQRDLHVNIAESVLTAQYYGSLKTAAARNSSGAKTKVFLMPLGGGVFNNPWESIAKSMSVAVEMLSEPEREKLNIEVLTWSGNPQEKNTMQKLLSQHKKLA